MDLKSAISRMGLDEGQLLSEYEKVSGMLARLGLSECESRGYVALVVLGSSSANLVADVGQMPRTSAYKVLKALERKGFVQSKSGRPVVFSAVDPVVLGERFAEEVKDAFNKLGSVKDLLSEKGVPQLVYTILGRERVLEKIGEMLDKAEHSFVISSPSMAEIRRRLGKRFAAALSRGVSIKVITAPFIKVPRGVDVVRRDALIATDVISDGKTALLAAPDLSACGYTDNEALSRHLEEFLRIMEREPR